MLAGQFAILIKKKCQYLVVIILNGLGRFFYTPFIAFVPVEIDVIVRGEIVIIPAQRGILLYAA